MAETFPTDWREQPCYLVAVPAPLAPYVGGLLKIAEQRGFWQSDTDYLHGYTAVTELEGCLMTMCLNALLERQDALYRLVNTALLGQSYSIDSLDPLVVTPAIEPAVDLTILDQDSIMGRLDRVTQLLDNSINGTATDLYSYSPSVKDQLQAILDAIAADETDLGTVITDLELIIGALA